MLVECLWNEFKNISFEWLRVILLDLVCVCVCVWATAWKLLFRHMMLYLVQMNILYSNGFLPFLLRGPQKFSRGLGALKCLNWILLNLKKLIKFNIYDSRGPTRSCPRTSDSTERVMTFEYQFLDHFVYIFYKFVEVWKTFITN